jgi:anthranilate/para-aminobenzoate synthase component II
LTLLLLDNYDSFVHNLARYFERLGQSTCVVRNDAVDALGDQTIAEALGGRVVRAARPVHGQTSPVHHDGTGIFTGLPSPLAACRYHSLVVEPASLPATLRPTAWTDDGILMAFEHVELPVYGVQFHPEAILTEGGHRLLANFLCLAGLETTGAPDDLAADELSAPTADARPLPTQPVTF